MYQSAAAGFAVWLGVRSVGETIGVWLLSVVSTNVRTSASVMRDLQAEAGIGLQVLGHEDRVEPELQIEVALVSRRSRSALSEPAGSGPSRRRR